MIYLIFNDEETDVLAVLDGPMLVPDPLTCYYEHLGVGPFEFRALPDGADIHFVHDWKKQRSIALATWKQDLRQRLAQAGISPENHFLHFTFWLKEEHHFHILPFDTLLFRP